MLRSKIKEEDKWDLTKYFKNDKEYEKMYNETLNLLDDMVSRKGTIMRSANDLYEFLVLDDKLSINLEKIYVYSYILMVFVIISAYEKDFIILFSVNSIKKTQLYNFINLASYVSYLFLPKLYFIFKVLPKCGIRAFLII